MFVNVFAAMLPYEKLARIYAADRKFNRQNKSVSVSPHPPTSVIFVRTYSFYILTRG